MSAGLPAEPVTPLVAHLRRLIHGSCEPQLLSSLHQALARDPLPPGMPSPPHEQQVDERLRALCDAVPPARRLLADPDQLAAVLSWAAVSDPSLCMALVTHHLLCLGSMARLAPQHEELAPEFEALESGRARGGYLITEAGQANSHLATRTEAAFDPATREFLLRSPDDGAAKFCGTAAHGAPRTVVVLARLLVRGEDCGVFPFVVKLTGADGPLPGIEISSRLELGALPLDYALVRFGGVRLPYGNWLRDDASITADGTFRDPLPDTDARLGRTLCVGQGLWGTLPSVAAAVSRQSAVLALQYARQRRTQGRLAPGIPLLSYRSHQYALLGAFAESFALTCAASHARTLLRQSLDASGTRTGGGRDDAAAAAGTVPSGDAQDPMTFAPWAAVSRPLSAYKAHCVRAAARITAACQRLCGYSGHLDANRLAGYHGFHHAFDPAGGDSQLIYYDLGQSLTAEADPAVSPQEHPPVPTGASAALDPAWWSAVIEAHEQRLTQRLSHAHDQEAARGAKGFALWNPLLLRAGELGEAYASRLAAQDVTHALTRVTDPGAHSTLAALAALGGVTAARQWAGSLLTAGTLRPEDLDVLEGAAADLCDRLIPQLPLLEAAFGHPSDLVRAPLADEDYTSALIATLSWHSSHSSKQGAQT
ncbi:acyl-CoA dehydrogenase family protein [Streptomyces sp. A5-4]|uniref:acyl-CoA dehydrogenase family protein n=1 Tax=Streptomyces sp. A5-4 TaxID=3384771 RepID=UPI003DA8D3D1